MLSKAVDEAVDPIVVHPEEVGELEGSVSLSTPNPWGHGVTGVDLPKYNPSSFPEVDRVKIPTSSTFIDHDDLIYRVAVDLKRGRVPMLWGPAGVGKTQLARHIAYLMQVPFERIPLGETSEREDVTGHYELKGASTEWIQSRLARSFTKPGVICIDEWNAAPPAVLHVARPVLDDSAALALDAYDGRILLKHNHCFIIATGNPDWMPQYAGLLPLSESDADRLSHISVGWPKGQVEAEILLNHIGANNLDKVTAWQLICGLRAWADLRENIDGGSLGITAGTRSLMNFVECLQYHPVREAMAKVYQRMDAQTYSKVEQVLDHHNWARYQNPSALELCASHPDPAAELMKKMAAEAVEAVEEECKPSMCDNCGVDLKPCEECDNGPCGMCDCEC